MHSTYTMNQINTFVLNLVHILLLFRIMLNYASQCGGVVVSNDNFRDLYEESDAFKEIIELR